MHYKIDTDIPLTPASGGAARPKSPELLAIEELAKAPIGASIFFSGGNQSRIAAMTRAGVSGGGWASTRIVTERGLNGVRVWKSAEPVFSTKPGSGAGAEADKPRSFSERVFGGAR